MTTKYTDIGPDVDPEVEDEPEVDPDIEPEVEDEDEDTSTVDTNTSDIMNRLEKNDSDGSYDDKTYDSDEEAEDAEENTKNQQLSDGPPLAKKGIISEGQIPGVDEVSDEEYDSDTDDEDYLQKMDDSVRHNIIGEFHPEMIQHNDEEVETLCKIVRDADGIIIDPFHKTLPFVTKYEKARILGERSKQINSGAKPFIPIEKHMIDGYLIALREFEEKKIPFIIRRPLPNGGSEYWKLADLQILHDS
jgi:DNA-directed RNA polymerase I, II, and III subunit RPABC2